jgi:hypothetical protein
MKQTVDLVLPSKTHSFFLYFSIPIDNDAMKKSLLRKMKLKLIFYPFFVSNKNAEEFPQEKISIE